jgi:hypothetical protein
MYSIVGEIQKLAQIYRVHFVWKSFGAANQTVFDSIKIKKVLLICKYRKVANKKLYFYVCENRPSLWSSGQSSLLQIQISGFDSRRFQIFWEVVGLEPSPLSVVSKT